MLSLPWLDFIISSPDNPPFGCGGQSAAQQYSVRSLTLTLAFSPICNKDVTAQTATLGTSKVPAPIHIYTSKILLQLFST
jgi:hypothetical protein